MSIIRTASSLTLFCLAATAVAACTSTQDDAVAGDNQALTACDMTGTWAIKVETPVTWGGSFVVQAGSGVVTNWLRTARTQTGTEIVDDAAICGVETPDYTSTAVFQSEHYGIRFPEEIFETGQLGTFAIAGHLSSTEAGATFTSEPVAAVVGATMANPATDAWPANGALLVSNDVEGDAKPGITLSSAAGNDYKNPPLDAFQSARASKVYAAFRQVLTASGTVNTCDRVDGTGAITVIAGKPSIDQHVLGCSRENGTDCSASEFKLLDSAAPVYKPTAEGAVITMIRVPARTTCAEVRALDYAASANRAAPANGNAAAAR